MSKCIRCFTEWNGLGCICNACRQIEAIQKQTEEYEKARNTKPFTYGYEGPIRERTPEEQKRDAELKKKQTEDQSLYDALALLFIILAFLLIPSMIGFLFRVF